MAYCVQVGEGPIDFAPRAAAEQLDLAIAELTGGAKDDPVGAVHRARKALKKERSLLRLVRRLLDAETRRSENERIRDTARRLSGVRDADVMIEALDSLLERCAEQAPRAALMTVRTQLEADRRAIRSDADRSSVREQAVRELEGVRARIPSWKLSGEHGFDALEPGIKRGYRQGRRAMKRLGSEPEIEQLHDWRKRCKDLWYQLRLLEPMAPNVLAGHAEDAHRLSDLLGDDHDLAVLAARVGDSSHASQADTDAVLSLIETRRAELEVLARAVGERLYAETPKAFVTRMRAYWDSWACQSPARAAS